MEFQEIKLLDRTALLNYLAFLQICPENSSHLQTLQSLQNRVLEGMDVTSDKSLWSDLDDFQSGLFVENFICYSACQFRAFVSDSTEKPWQLCALVDALVKYRIATREELYSLFFFLCLSDKIVERLGFGYYELGNPENSLSIQLEDIDEKKQSLLHFSIAELNLIGHHRIDDFSFLSDYYTEKGCDVGLRPLLKVDDGFFVLSPNALVNCAWRELLKVMKLKMTDGEICDFYHATIAEEIHNRLSDKWQSNSNLREKGESVYTVVYRVFYHRYYVVTVAAKETKSIDIDSIVPPDGMDVFDVTPHLKELDEKLRNYDNEAEIVHIVIPVTMQNEFAVMTTHAANPVILIQWPPFSALLEKNEDNPLWLYYYAIDRKNARVLIAPDAKEEDVIALYLRLNHSFYMSDKAIGKQIAILDPGFALPLIYGIKNQACRHAVSDPPFSLVVVRDQECPKGLPFYESISKDGDMMIGEFMISNIFLKLPQNTKKRYPDLHAVGRSLILWYYALERYSRRPILMHNLKVAIKMDDSIKEGFVLEEAQDYNTLKVGRNLLGANDGHTLEKHLQETVLGEAYKKGYVLNTYYKGLIEDVFKTCPGGLIHRMDDHDLLCDTTIGSLDYYVVDGRRKAMVIGELAEAFNHYPVGPLTIEESKTLVGNMIHYLNKRIIAILEQYDLEKLLSSMMTLRDGLIFWHRTMVERYNYMISFYRFLGTEDPIQAERIHEFVETDLCTRCLIEYSLMKCQTHGEKVLDHDINAVEELYALMSELINMGYLSDYYKSPSFDRVIEVLPNGRFAYPNDENHGLNKYAKLITNDRLEHPEAFEAMSRLVNKLDYSEYEVVFKNVFTEEFGVSFEHFVAITQAIIRQMQDEKRGEWMEDVATFRSRIAFSAKVNEVTVGAYITAFSISGFYSDLSLFPMFNEHDTFPCRFKRKLGLINRPFCVFDSGGRTKVSFSYRGFVQSQFHLLENIRLSNYAGISGVMKSYIGDLNNKRGRLFEAGVFELFEKQKGLRCHRSAKIGPKDRLLNTNGALGDIDLMLIDNSTQRILLVEVKNYNECKTPYEAVDNEKKLLKDMKMAVKRDAWAKDNIELFEWYAQQSTAAYHVGSVMLTFNLNPVIFFRDDYCTALPVVWIRDIIENPKLLFEFGVYS